MALSCVGQSNTLTSFRGGSFMLMYLHSWQFCSSNKRGHSFPCAKKLRCQCSTLFPSITSMSELDTAPFAAFKGNNGSLFVSPKLKDGTCWENLWAWLPCASSLFVCTHVNNKKNTRWYEWGYQVHTWKPTIVSLLISLNITTLQRHIWFPITCHVNFSL